MAVLTTDPFELNEDKKAIANTVIKIVRKHLPNYEICKSPLVSGDYIYRQGTEPSDTKSDGISITNIRFGILSPLPEDTRKGIWDHIFKDAPERKVVGAIDLTLKDNISYVTTFKIEVFGTENKPIFVELAKKLDESEDLYEWTTNSILLCVGSPQPKQLS